MISIKKDFASVPDKLDTVERTDLIKLSLTEKNKHDFKPKVYRDGTLKELETLYHHKCGYCETDTTAGAPMQVDHYRPKAEVTKEKEHEGYYWIAYEWSNLLLSCSRCNNKKRNQFPITGIRVTSPTLNPDGMPDDDSRLATSPLFQNEKPLLLHPEIDKVEDFFIFLPDGRLAPIGDNPRALETISICQLNRSELVLKRLSVLNKLFNRIQKELKELEAKVINGEQAQHSIKRVFEELVLLQSPENEYSRFGYFMFVKFEKFFIERFPPKQGQAVRKLFELFLEKKL